MSGNWGKNIQLSIFGESHGAAIGITVNGIPAGMPVDEQFIAKEMARRAPNGKSYSTARSEADKVHIISGVLNGKTTGAPICGIIKNSAMVTAYIGWRTMPYSPVSTTICPSSTFTVRLKYAFSRITSA